MTGFPTFPSSASYSFNLLLRQNLPALSAAGVQVICRKKKGRKTVYYFRFFSNKLKQLSQHWAVLLSMPTPLWRRLKWTQHCLSFPTGNNKPQAAKGPCPMAAQHWGVSLSERRTEPSGVTAAGVHPRASRRQHQQGASPWGTAFPSSAGTWTRLGDRSEGMAASFLTISLAPNFASKNVSSGLSTKLIMYDFFPSILSISNYFQLQGFPEA